VRKRSRLEQAGGIWPADGLVFTTRTGRPIEPRAVGRRFDLRCAKAGVRRIRVHDTRRTCGSLLAAFDVHPRVAMRILRHSKIAITMELYTMVPDEATLAALKRLSDALGSADAALPDEGSRCPLLYTAAVHGGNVFEKCVELRGLEPLAFWMQTIFLAYFYVA
jgi:hypothetical protein